MDDDSDNEERVPKKHKKRKKPQEEGPLKIGQMKAKVFTHKDLPPFERMLWCTPIEDSTASSKATELLRKRMGLRVPDVRRSPCKFWQKGTCVRGAACSFAHDNGPADGRSNASRCPPPVVELVDPGLPRCFGRAMLHLGHPKPSPIQAQAWSAALCGHDLLCRAPTGSGKTLAYLLPAAAHALAANPPPKVGTGPICLVLAPTRELAMQIHGQAQRLRRPCGISSIAVYGGEPREDQVEALEGSAFHILVATTGRLVDMVMSNIAKLARVTMLVLDEADQLLTLGFSLQVSQVLSQMRPDRQTLCFSATLSERLEAAAGSWLKAPMRVYAEQLKRADESERGPAPDEESADDEEADDDDDDDDDGDDGHGAGGDGAAGAGGEEDTSLSQIPRNIEQRFELCEEGGKAPALLRLLSGLGHAVKSHATVGESVGDATGVAAGSGGADGEDSIAGELAIAWHEGGRGGKAPASGGYGDAVSVGKAARNAPRVMCFVNEIKSLKRLGARLRACGVRCEALHGEKSQRERDDALRLFKAGAAPVLLTTDLGSRGLDVARLPAVVNFDPPTSAAQYVHRAGRTGRQGAAGLVVSLLKRDAASRHFATQVRGILKRGQVPTPPALAELLPPPKAAEPAAAGDGEGRSKPAGSGGGAKGKRKGAPGGAAAAAASEDAKPAGKRRREAAKGAEKKGRQGTGGAEDEGGGGSMMDLMCFAQSIM